MVIPLVNPAQFRFAAKGTVEKVFLNGVRKRSFRSASKLAHSFKEFFNTP